MTDELWRWDAETLTRAIRTRAISSRAATEACLARLAAVNPKINAVVAVTDREALAAADDADAAVKRGEALGPLHGVPVTVKVNTDQKGWASTNGVVAFKELVAKEDNPSVANLRRAGAVIVGRTNTPCFSYRWFTGNDLHGTTLNPWDKSRTPGGSSGGAAAACAAGIGPIAHGTDIGGSIRYPAYACGLAGLRPTLGRIPSYNPSGAEERPLTAQIGAVHGPLARRVRDLRLALAAMAGADPLDVWSVPVPLELASPPRPIRVALVTPPREAHPAVKDAVAKAGKWLAEAGYAVEETTPPDLAGAAQLWLDLLMSDARRSIVPLAEKFGDARLRRALEAMAAQTRELDLAGFATGIAQRATHLRAWLLFLERFPLVVMASSYEPPFPQDLDQEGAAIAPRLMKAQEPQLALPLLGLPGLAVPTGLADGVPMGVQVVASRYREDLCLAAGEVIEARAGGGLGPVDPR
jgi:amidase